MPRRYLFLSIFAIGFLAQAQKVRVSLKIESSSFDDRGSIPRRFTCDGAGVSPALSWSGEPEGTRSFALVMADADARDFVHWLLWDVPSSVHSLPEGAAQRGVAGGNDFGKGGYGGPCPPQGVHHYVIQLLALDVPSLNLAAGSRRDAMNRAAKGHVLARKDYQGAYGR